MTKLSKRSMLKTLAATALATACALAPVAPAAAADKVNVGALRFTSHAASFVAFERGYFADEGLDVEFTFFQAAQPMAVAIASGDVDFGITAISATLLAFGVANFIGNYLGSMLVARSLLLTLAIMPLTIAALAVLLAT